MSAYQADASPRFADDDSTMTVLLGWQIPRCSRSSTSRIAVFKLIGRLC